MGKSKGVSKRRRKSQKPKFVHKSKLKRQRLRILRKSTAIECKTISEVWDKKKNVNSNLKSMGLSYDPNKTLSIPNMYEEIESMDVNNDKKLERNQINKKDSNKKSKVIEELEAIANKPQDKNFRFGPETVKFCVYMIEKYGDNYKAMMRDKMNYYQESAGQLRQKIKKFKSIPSHWNAYTKAKAMADKELGISSNNINMDVND